ncbi:MAG TPA: response regulator [Ginsengibacter sp.]|nr:response regulator [Ginsengibacter sp.]HRP43561.1 response regulator [Ginsengibacter sp.]
MEAAKEKKNAIRVAIIESHLTLRNDSIKQLESAGFTVFLQTGTGQDALQKIRNSHTVPDVCIIEDDIEAANLLLKTYPSLKVLISSTNDNKTAVMNMLEAGVSGYILRYADPDEMITAVKALHENRKYFSAGVGATAKKYFERQL